MHEDEGGVGGRDCAEEECRLFPCVQENCAGCSQVRLALMRKVALAMWKPKTRQARGKAQPRKKPQCSSLLASHAADTHGGAQQR